MGFPRAFMETLSVLEEKSITMNCKEKSQITKVFCSFHKQI